ncbi:hypothetical protein VOLCADRAFT_90084 [Volvox carteri f. nagariensis]|uniref:Uncharacterized protein n=1 Tax=Volvox carteri f. nagariensis TaxID=3068 RepID=D8TTF6_VOLCA|nr:uncharacterized protein VOLCADRAFT_90084 [Volvox carteri f. nagariensis]EFJ49297.1 hypothetical protein VOLCADRAFT_90084 [Volvox carteri f. nagariensis]|eukprot:XP_002949745.1 hypothetical protein VOLCADRAFT_90084 [Volvox carteri f. nagariensis]
MQCRIVQEEKDDFYIRYTQTARVTDSSFQIVIAFGPSKQPTGLDEHASEFQSLFGTNAVTTPGTQHEHKRDLIANPSVVLTSAVHDPARSPVCSCVRSRVSRMCSQQHAMQTSDTRTVSGLSGAPSPPAQVSPVAEQLQQPLQPATVPLQQGTREQKSTASATATPTSYPPCICAYLGLGSSECQSAVWGVCNGMDFQDARGPAHGSPGDSPGLDLNHQVLAAGAAGAGKTGKSEDAAGAVSTSNGVLRDDGGDVICSLAATFQLNNASSILSGTALRAIYRQLRGACFPGAITAPSYCNCAVDPFSANCALSLTSLCSAGDPLCRLTLEAWEGQARATAVLRTFFSSTCSGTDSDGSGLAAAGSAEVPLQTSGNGTTSGAVVVRLELPGVNRAMFEERYRTALTSLLASAAGVPPGSVLVSSAMELPALPASLMVRPGGPNAATSPPTADPLEGRAAVGDTGLGATGSQPRGWPPGAVFGANVKTGPAAGFGLDGSQNRNVVHTGDVYGGTNSGGSGLRNVGRRRLMQQPAGAETAQGGPAISPQDGPRGRSLLVTLTIAAEKPVLTEQRLMAAFANGTWLSALHLQLGLPYAVASFTTETYIHNGAIGDGGELPDGNRTSTITPPPQSPDVSMQGQTDWGEQSSGTLTQLGNATAAAGPSSSTILAPGLLKASSSHEAAGNGGVSSDGKGFNADGVSRGKTADAPPSLFILHTVIPIVVSVVGGLLCAAAAVGLALFLRGRQRRRRSYIVSARWQEGTKDTPSSSAPGDSLFTSASQVVTVAEGKTVAARGIKLPAPRIRHSDSLKPVSDSPICDCQPSESGAVGPSCEAGGFTFPSLTPKAAAARAAKRAEFGTSPCPNEDVLPSSASLVSNRLAASGSGPGGGALSTAEDTDGEHQLPQAPDSPVLGLHPMRAQPSAILEATKTTGHGSVPLPQLRGNPLACNIMLPRWDSGLSGTSNVSHMGQMSPSCDVFAGATLDCGAGA